MVKRSLKTRTRKQLSKNKSRSTVARNKGGKKTLVKTAKKGKGGGVFSRMGSMSRLESAQTHCCNDEEEHTKIGSCCHESQTGQCYPTQYKYRCFNKNFEKVVPDGNGNTKKDKLNFKRIDLNTDDYNEKGANCQYISSMAGKAVGTVENVAGVAAKVLPVKTIGKVGAAIGTGVAQGMGWRS